MISDDHGKSGVLGSLVLHSLKYPLILFILSALVFGYGAYSLETVKYDIFPDFAIPFVQIQTEAPGLTPLQVEQLVTQPLETVLIGIQGVKDVRSNSIQGLSVITVIFDDKTDIYLDRQLVAERLATAMASLPRGIVPVMTPLTSSAGVILTIGLASEHLSLMDLRTIADWEIKPRLMAVPGVADIVVVGGEVKQLQIQMDPDVLARQGISMQDVVDKAALATSIKGAGFIDTFNQRVTIQSEGQTVTPDELARTLLLSQNGNWLTLEEIGQVVSGPAPPAGASQIMGTPGVILQITSQYNANTVTLTENLLKALDDILPSLNAREVKLFDKLFRPADFIQIALQNIEIALLIGIILVVLVLFVFLMYWRTVLIALIAIPLSLMAAVISLNYAGYSLNIMTLGGLAIAIGLLVDDAVITVENIFRRVRESNALPQPCPLLKVVLDATLEVRGAVVYATLTIVLVFFPVLVMSGVAGKLFGPLVAAYIAATFSSLIVALTVTPTAAYFLISGAAREPVTIRWLKQEYKKWIELIERFAIPFFAAAVLFIACGLGTFFLLKKTYLPSMSEDYFILHVNFTPGTSLQESVRVGSLITEELLKNPQVSSIGQRAGRGKLGVDIHGTHQSEMDVLVKTNNIAALRKEIRSLLSQFPGINFSLDSFLTERINETLSGYTAGFVINVFGNNLNRLDLYSNRIAAKLANIPGAVDILLQSPPGIPEMTVELNQEALIRWGFNAVDVLDALSTAFQGKRVGEIYQGNKIFDVVAILDPEYRNQPDKLNTLLLRNPSSEYVSLEQLANIYPSSGRYNIQHEGARRVQTITCNISGADIRTFESNVRGRILAKLELPPDMYVELHGIAEAQKAAQDQLIYASLIAGFVILLILYMILGSPAYLLLLLCNLPFALAGGIFAVYLTGGLFSIGSMVGFVTVFGITLRNSIMIVLHAQHLVLKEKKNWSRETVILAAQERLAPILMTACATALGLLPIALQTGRAGSEIEGPTAIVILGGLVTSTLLNLLLLPTLMLRFSNFFKIENPSG